MCVLILDMVADLLTQQLSGGADVPASERPRDSVAPLQRSGWDECKLWVAGPLDWDIGIQSLYAMCHWCTYQ